MFEVLEEPRAAVRQGGSTGKLVIFRRWERVGEFPRNGVGILPNGEEDPKSKSSNDNAVSVLVSLMSTRSCCIHQRRPGCTARDRGREKRRCVFSVFAHSTQTCREDDGEKGTLEEVEEHNCCLWCCADVAHSHCACSDGSSKEKEEEIAGFDEVVESSTCESPGRKTGMADRGPGIRIDGRVEGLFDVGAEGCGYALLGTDIAELAKYA